ncbi:MAG TPA: hypothetical protein PKZ69_01355 [Candidatus Cloacimonadota bacterium]|nr:hypothetical protein [Candidatus Cloacimonadota bacterium]HPK40243.1 hypothetical protein [Candidatus Cloacimonadota bacterium]
MNNVHKLFALIMENLGQVAVKIDGLYSLQSNINTLDSKLTDFMHLKVVQNHQLNHNY